MVSYLARWDQSNNNTSTNFVSITAVTWPIRIAQVLLWSGASDNSQPIVSVRYEGGVASGGSSAPLVALRQGAPAATATARVGALTFTGTRRVLNTTVQPPGRVTEGTTSSVSGAATQMEFPLTTVIVPGSTFAITSGWFSTIGGCDIYFEELRLFGSY